MRDRLTALRSLHPFPSFLVAALTVAIVPLADETAPPGRYLALGLGMLLYQFAIGLVNDIVDASDDRRDKPWKPIARGTLPGPVAIAAAAGCILGGLVLTSGLPRTAWLVGVAGLACGLLYDVYLKRTALSWLPYAVGLPLVPVWVFAASEAWRALLWWAFPLGALLGLALNLANEAPDVSADRGRGLPARLGERRARFYATVLFAVVACTAAALLIPISVSHAVIVLVVGVVASAAAPWSRFLGRDGLFGLLATASGAVAIVFLGAL